MKYEIINKIEKIAIEHPNKIAYTDNIFSLTYKELIDKAKSLANKLETYTEKYVVIYGHKELFVPITILASLISNKTYVPIDYYFPESRIEYILKELKSYIIISNKPIDKYNTFSIETLPLNGTKKKIENKYAYAIFTSGSTGHPKGILINKNNLSNFVNWISNSNPFNTYINKNVFNQASFSFDLSVADFYYSVCNGHTFIAYDNINDSPSYIFDSLTKNKINIMFVTPTFIKLCLLNKKFNSMNFPHLECVYFCGEILQKKLVKKIYERFNNITLINAYGPTEATSAVSLYKININEIDQYEQIPIGVINNSACDIYIKNNEIVLKGKSVFDSYINEKTKTNEYYTGDIGEIVNGLMFFKGRFDNQIKYSGYRIELEEIENCINNIDNVNESLIVPLRNKDNEVTQLITYIVKNKDIEKEDIIKHLSKCLPKYMIPTNIIFVNKLPINNNDKIIRKIIENDKC